MKTKSDQLFEYFLQYSDFYRLPIIVDDGCDVFPTLFEKMDRYLELIRDNDYLKENFYTAQNIVNRMKEAIDAYWKGKFLIANQKIKLILNDTKKLGSKLIISTLDECLFDDEKKQLYKARIGGFDSYQEYQMFHIPFNKRGLVQNQRYSINGMPCLYLGTSTYVCWEELERPDFNSFWISRFEVINENLKILNLSYTIQDICGLMNSSRTDTEKEKFIVDYILYWILLCACSFHVKNNNRVFREEYIVPQLIMQNIRESDIDGIMYFSVRGTYDDNYSSLIMKNFAFPADDYDVFCDDDNTKFDHKKYVDYALSTKLKRSFALTAPLNMGMIRVAESNNAMGRASRKTKYYNEAISKGATANLPQINIYRTGSSIKLSEKYYLRYEFTNFYEIEVALGLMFTNILP